MKKLIRWVFRWVNDGLFSLMTPFLAALQIERRITTSRAKLNVNRRGEMMRRNRVAQSKWKWIFNKNYFDLWVGKLCGRSRSNYEGANLNQGKSRCRRAPLYCLIEAADTSCELSELRQQWKRIAWHLSVHKVKNMLKTSWEIRKTWTTWQYLIFVLIRISTLLLDGQRSFLELLVQSSASFGKIGTFPIERVKSECVVQPNRDYEIWSIPANANRSV